jgi:hypothetical protein
MKQLILTIAVVFMLQNQIYCQLKNYNDKGKVEILSQKTTLSVTGIPTNFTKDSEHTSDSMSLNANASALNAASAILPPVIDLVFNSAKVAVEGNALAYKGEYKCSVSEDKFYISNNSALLPKLTFKRIIKTKEGEDSTAVEIELIPELSSDGTAFRYYIKDKLIYNLSIAKTKGDYDYIDLNIDIKFKSIYIDKTEYKINDLRTSAISIPMIYVGHTTHLAEKVYSGWIPLPARSTKKNTQIVTVVEEKSIVKTNNSGIKDSSSEITTTKKSNLENYDKLINNTGLYEIEFSANETNPYKIKAENKETLVESSGESATLLLKAIIKVLTEKEEKKEEEK